MSDSEDGMHELCKGKVRPIPQVRVKTRKKRVRPAQRTVYPIDPERVLIPESSDDRDALLVCDQPGQEDAIHVAPNEDNNTTTGHNNWQQEEEEEEEEEVDELCFSHHRVSQWGSPKGMILTGTRGTLDVTYESLNYVEDNSPLSRRPKRELDIADITGYYTYIFNRCMGHIVVGFLVGGAAYFIQFAIELISKWKYSLIRPFMTPENLVTNGGWAALGVANGLNMCFCILAALLGIHCPVSTGSGIPQIKCYLNGVKIHAMLRIKTFFFKVFGVIMSVCGGLPVGKEGPMIHSGAVIGGGVSQGRSTSIPAMSFRFFQFFRSDVLKRDFVGAGAAAGVSAAFGAPLGGVAFSLEEGCSVISLPMLIEFMICSMCSKLALCMCRTVFSGKFLNGLLMDGGLLSFGAFEGQVTSIPYAQMFMFIVMGVIGGLLGALWNGMNYKLTQFRMRYYQRRGLRLLEVIFWSLIVTTSAFYSMAFITDCYPAGMVKQSANFSVQLTCEDGKTHTGASIWFETPENAVKDFFHMPANFYRWETLLVFFLVYYFLTCVTYGLPVSSGLFVPSIVMGACWGRLLWMGLTAILPSWQWGFVGRFALVGSVAQLAGIVRLTFSITIILIEATAGMDFMIPLLFASIIAKLVGDIFNEGIYDIHIDLCGVPYVHCPSTALKRHHLVARDLMSCPVWCLKARSSFDDIAYALESTNFNAFPIIPDYENDIELKDKMGVLPPPMGQKHFGQFLGIILRSELLTMIFERQFDTNPTAPLMSHSIFKDQYPFEFQTGDIFLHGPRGSEFRRTHFMDLRNVMSTGHIILPHHPATDTIQMFRAHLRHLVVVDSAHNVVGMITRKDAARIHIHGGSVGLKTFVAPGKGSFTYPKAD